MTRADVLLAVVAAALAPCALSHYWVDNPPARNACNGGTGWSKSGGSGSGDRSPARGGVPGVCGDPFIDYRGQGNSEYFQPEYACEPAQYESGSEFTMDIVLAAHHGGFLKCSVCDQENAADWTDACFEGNDLTTTMQSSTPQTRYYLLDDYVLEGERDNAKGTWYYSINWTLPPVTCERCIMSCQFVTAHLCSPMLGCDPDICGGYAEGLNPYQWPDDPSRNDFACEAGETPSPGEAPQIFRNCIDISLTGGSGAAQPVEAVDPVGPVESIGPAEGPAEELAAELAEEPAEEPEEEPVMNPVDPSPAPMPEEASGSSASGSETFTLLVRDMANGKDTSPLGATIALSDYPDGFNIRAEPSGSADDVKSVDFETNFGETRTEKKYTYDMFGSDGKWSNAMAGATEILTVTMKFEDGTSETLEATISFE